MVSVSERCPRGMLVTMQQSRFMDANSTEQGHHEFRGFNVEGWGDRGGGKK